MEKGLLCRLGICILTFGLCLYSYVDKQNELTSLNINIPELKKEIRVLEEQNRRFQYEIDHFENPQHLMELARRPEFSHLKHPLLQDILTIPEGIALKEINEKKNSRNYLPTSYPLGAK